MEGPLDRQASRWIAFRRGLLQRNPLVLAAAAALCLFAVLGVQHFFFAGGLTAVGENRLVRHEHDDQVHVAYQVNRLGQDPPAGRVLYVFGGSGAMEAVTGDRSLAAQIERCSGEPVTVVSLANHAQSLAQNLVLVDNLPAGEATLLIGLAPMRFNTTPAEDEGLLASRTLLLRSPRLRELAPILYGREASWTGGLPGAFDFISAYVRERVSSGSLPGRRLHYLRHYFGPDASAASGRAKRATLESVWEYNRSHYAANHEYNMAVLRELVKLARERGFEVAFFEQPLNTEVAGDWGGVLPRYRAEVERVADCLRRSLPAHRARPSPGRRRLRRPLSPPLAGARPLAGTDGAGSRRHPGTRDPHRALGAGRSLAVGAGASAGAQTCVHTDRFASPGSG